MEIVTISLIAEWMHCSNKPEQVWDSGLENRAWSAFADLSLLEYLDLFGQRVSHKLDHVFGNRDPEAS